ncbi:MAG: WhiB family transcriptional regulator [Actinomycetota bacterium]
MSAQQVDDLWQYRAACRGPHNEIFFPPPRLERRPDKRRREQRAKEICAGCAVLRECRDYAMKIREQHGIWGGMTEKERRALVGDAENN